MHNKWLAHSYLLHNIKRIESSKLILRAATF